MRKLFLSSIALLVFSVSIIVFQMSCSKEAGAHEGDDDKKANNRTILYIKTPETGFNELWTMDINGNNLHQINIALSQDYYISSARVADHNNKIVFTADKLTETENFRVFFKCNLDGSGLTQIFQGEEFENYGIQDVY
ncbi:MAG TPA: hypothetical protein VK483_04870 [Chitinophagaceae bacterium]|nr:hypothetical protein [Chitinophagaceae bacterium]